MRLLTESKDGFLQQGAEYLIDDGSPSRLSTNNGLMKARNDS
jgi:hypothetical protein